MANSNYSATCGYLNTALHMEIVSALVFISDYVASNAPRMILKEAIPIWRLFQHLYLYQTT